MSKTTFLRAFASPLAGAAGPRFRRHGRVIAMLGLAGGFLTGIAMAGSIGAPASVALAQGGCGIPSGCGGLAHSALTVRHFITSPTPGYHNVEPNAGSVETWNVQGFYDTASGDPNCILCDHGETAPVAVNVTYNALTKTWIATCPACNPAGPFVAATAVQVQQCAQWPMGPLRTTAYRLVMTVNTTIPINCPGGPTSGHLSRVNYTSGVMPAGRLLDNEGSCTPGRAVAPIFASYHTNDNGAFECPGDISILGPEIGITYQ